MEFHGRNVGCDYKDEWLGALCVFGPAFAAVLSFFPKTHHRYFLPCAALFSILAGCGLPALLEVWGLRRISPRVRAGVIAVLAAALLAWQIPRLWALRQAFAGDTRRELIGLLAGLPKPVRLLQDRRGQIAQRDLEGAGGEVVGEVWEGEWEEPGANVAGRATHFLAASDDYGRYFRERGRIREEFLEEYLRRRAFYEWVFEHGEKIWERPAGEIFYTQPHLELFRLPNPPP